MAERTSRRYSASIQTTGVLTRPPPGHIDPLGTPGTGETDIDPVVLDAVRAQSAASDFNVERAYEDLGKGDFDPRDADQVAHKLFPGLDGAALKVAAELLWRHAQAHAHSSVLDMYRATLSHFLPSEPAEREKAADSEAPPPSDTPASGVPVSPDQALARCITQLESGKYSDTYTMVSGAFAGLTGRPLLRQLVALKQYVEGANALDEIEKQAVLNVIQRLRDSDASAMRRKTMLQSIKTTGVVQNLHERVVREMHQKGETIQAIGIFLDGLPISALMETLGRLLDPSHPAAPALVQLARDRLDLINRKERALLLAPLIDWYGDEEARQGPPPPLPIANDVSGSLALLRQIVQTAAHDDQVGPQAAQQLREAFDAYRDAIDVMTARGQVDDQWIKAIGVFLRDHDDPRQALEAMVRYWGSRTTAAAALRAAMGSPGAWTKGERGLLERIVAELVAVEGVPLDTMLSPTDTPTLPVKLQIASEVVPKRNVSPEAREHFNEKQQKVAENQKLVQKDAKVVRQLLSEGLHLRQPASMGEAYEDVDDAGLCVQLLAISPLPRDRLLLALGVAARDTRFPEHALAQRLLDKMSDAVPAIMKVKPLTLGEKLKAVPRIVGNGIREGSAHWVGVGVMRTTFRYAGPWGTVIMTIAGTGVLPFLASRYLHSLESLDYKVHPRKVVRFLLDIVPSLGALAGVGASIYVGVRYGAFSEEGVHEVLVSMAVNNLARFLIRQPFQSWTQSPFTRGLSVVDVHGNPPTERFQYHFNIVRDVGYTLPYIVASVCAPELMRGVADDLFPVLDDFVSVLGHSFLMAVPGAAVEAWDGMWVDVLMAVAVMIVPDYLVQNGTQNNPGRNFAHWLRQGFARDVAMSLPDAVLTLSAAMFRAGYRAAGYALAALAGVLGGMFGALRGRTFNYLVTTQSTVENGSVLPDGLLTAVGRGAVFLGQGVVYGVTQVSGGVSSLLAGGGAATSGTGGAASEPLQEITVNRSAAERETDSSDSDSEYFDPENDDL